MGSISESAPVLLPPKLSEVSTGISLLKPLSRRGHGPGMIVLVHEDDNADQSSHESATIIDGVPSPAMKWAEEGYTVVEIRNSALSSDSSKSQNALGLALDALEKCEVCEPKDTVGLIAYSPSSWNQLASSLTSYPKIVGAVLHADAKTLQSLAPSPIPSTQHLAGELPSDLKLQRTKQLMQYAYPTSASFAFASAPTNNKALPGYHYANEAVSHTRNLTFLKKLMDGPWFDLEAIWDEHTYFEFEARDVEKTMATMVQEPYVNHIPTITGGIGRTRLSDFYSNHFVFQNPADTQLELISRTVGIDRVVDEFIYKFTHDMKIDWLLPGIPPTHRYAEIPFTAIVNIRGDRLYHEHIAWDQATALRQLGLMPEYLPWPADLSVKGVKGEGGDGKKWEFQVPTADNKTAEKMRDKNAVPSNELFAFKMREVN